MKLPNFIFTIELQNYMIRWKINKDKKERYKHINNVTDILHKKNDIFRTYSDKEVAEKEFDEWMKKLESEEEFDWSPWGFFGAIGLALVRRTFPALFANQVVGVQAMSQPVGLAYAMRVVYNEDEDKPDAENNV